MSNADTKQLQRLHGLDAIRAVCALAVMCSHVGALPRMSGLWEDTLPGRLMVGLYGNLFPASAAVAVFFIISGLCIHLPFAAVPHIHWPSYFLRRYLRIGIPLLASKAIAVWVGVEQSLYAESIVWSLYAELIYYSLYPAIRKLAARFGFPLLIVAAYVAAIVMIALHPGAKAYPSFGLAGNWLIGLPAWLLGCLLAERIGTAAAPTPRAMWCWRAGVWSTAVTASVLRFHSPIGYPVSLSVFVLIAAPWLAREIAYFQHRQPWRFLESMGAWSYSIYVMHQPAKRLLARLDWLDLGSLANRSLKVAFILGACYLFYRLVEKPAHHLARWLASRTRPNRQLPSASLTALVQVPGPLSVSHHSNTDEPLK